MTTPKELHPLADRVAHMYQQKSDGEVYLPDDAPERIKAEIAALSESADLKNAVTGLVALAAHLDLDLGNKAESERLLQITLSAVPALTKQRDDVNHKDNQVVREAADTLRGFSGARSPKYVLGDKEPKGKKAALIGPVRLS